MIWEFVKAFSYFVLHYTYNGRFLSYPTRSANDPPLVKSAVGKSGYPFNRHFIGNFLKHPL